MSDDVAGAGNNERPPGVVQLNVPARRRYVRLVRLVVAESARLLGPLSSRQLADLRVAVSEVCTNAAEACGDDGTADMRIDCQVAGGAVVVTVQDDGPGFNPEDVPLSPHAPELLSLDQERGRGLPLARTLVDRLAVDSTPAGTSVTLEMTLPDPGQVPPPAPAARRAPFAASPDGVGGARDGAVPDGSAAARSTG